MGFYDDLKSKFDIWNRMNDFEKDTFTDIVLANPGQAFVLKEAKEEAERWSWSVSYSFTSELTPKQAEVTAKASRNDGPADALRHCCWSALLASQLAYNDAMRVVMSHEFGATEGSLASKMDIHNNSVGLRIGVANKRAGGASPAGIATNEGDIKEAVMNAFLHGQLYVLSKDKSQLEPSRSLLQGR
jgi:hypothetical protein